MAQNLNNCQIQLTGSLQNVRRQGRINTESKFTGTSGRLFFLRIGCFFLSIIPLIGLPNALCIYERWVCKHTYIVGMPLVFEGTAGKLLGRFFVWGFFSVITLGLYGLIVAPVRYKQWVTSHTVFGEVA